MDKADAEQLRGWAESSARDLRDKAHRLCEAAAADRAAIKHRNDEISGLHLGDAALATLAATTAPGDSRDVLRERYATLRQAWRAAVTDERLADRIDAASHDLEAARRDVGALEEPIRARARALLVLGLTRRRR